MKMDMNKLSGIPDNTCTGDNVPHDTLSTGNVCTFCNV